MTRAYEQVVAYCEKRGDPVKYELRPVCSDGHPPMTDAHMLHFVNGSLSAIEDVSLDRMKAAVVKLREQIKKHLGVE